MEKVENWRLVFAKMATTYITGFMKYLHKKYLTGDARMNLGVSAVNIGITIDIFENDQKFASFVFPFEIVFTETLENLRKEVTQEDLTNLTDRSVEAFKRLMLTSIKKANLVILEVIEMIKEGRKTNSYSQENIENKIKEHYADIQGDIDLIMGKRDESQGEVGNLFEKMESFF